MADDVVQQLRARWSGEVELAPDLFAAERAEVTVTNWRNFDMKLTVELQDGRYRCSSLTVNQRDDGAEVSGEALRSIPVGGIVQAAVEQMTDKPEIPEVTKRLINRVPTRETLLAVVQVYQLAFAMGLPPKKAVADKFEIATSTAGNWIARAREADLFVRPSNR